MDFFGATKSNKQAIVYKHLVPKCNLNPPLSIRTKAAAGWKLGSLAFSALNSAAIRRTSSSVSPGFSFLNILTGKNKLKMFQNNAAV